MSVAFESLDHGERIRRYPSEPPIDVPEPELPAIQYARQLDRYVERRERYKPEPQVDWVTKHPYLSFALSAASLVGSGYYLYRRMR